MIAYFRIILSIGILLTSHFAYSYDCTEANSKVKAIDAASEKDEKKLLDLEKEYPKCGRVQVALGKYYYNRERWRAAHEHYNKALEFFPYSTGIRSKIRKIQKEMPLFVEKLEDFKIANKTIKDRCLGGAKKLPPLAVAIQFKTSSAEIDPQGKELLDEFAKMIKNDFASYRFDVQGHTDTTYSGPEANKHEHNMNLSRKRALSVKNYLVNIHSISPDKLEVKYYAYDKPIATNLTEEGRKQNRRVQFEGDRVYR